MVESLFPRFKLSYYPHRTSPTLLLGPTDDRKLLTRLVLNFIGGVESCKASTEIYGEV